MFLCLLSFRDLSAALCGAFKYLFKLAVYAISIWISISQFSLKVLAGVIKCKVCHYGCLSITIVT